MAQADPLHDEPARRDWRIGFGLVTTVVWLALGVFYVEQSLGWSRFFSQPISDIGEFLDGAVAPLAFLWLVLGLFLQQNELAQNNRAIRLQYEAMRKTAEHAELQARAIQANELHARQDTFIELAKLVSGQLEVIAGMLFLSTQGPAGDGVVSAEEMDELWSRLGSGDPAVFSRRLIGLRFSLADVEQARELFYGTAIRRRHTETYLHSFERLLRAAAGCDPEGMIQDALLGGAHGRLSRAMQELGAGAPSPAGARVPGA